LTGNLYLYPTLAAFSVHLKPSVQLTVILSVAHFLVVFLLWPLTLPMSVKLLGVALLVTSLVYYLRHYALLKSPESIVAFELSEAMQCMLNTRSGKHIPCVILGSTFVAPYLVVLNLRPENKWLDCSVVIFPDSMDGEEFRQLRVLLRWKWKPTNT
jgi:toxin CptA